MGSLDRADPQALADPAPTVKRDILHLLPPAPPPAPRAPVEFSRIEPDGPFADAGLAAALPLLRKACGRTRGRYSPETVARGFRAGALHLWLGVSLDGEVKAVLVTHAGKYDTGLRVLQIILAAGGGLVRDEVADAIGLLKAFTEARDLERIEFHGARMGWLRWLRKLGLLDGFRELGVCGEMEV